MNKTIKKLYRSRTDSKIFGVCGGLGKYFGLDSNVIRIGFVLFALCAGGGILAYLLIALILPIEPAK